MKKTMKELMVYAKVLRKRGGSEKKVFEMVLMEFEGSPYQWGGQSLSGSDCSGSVCTAMNLALGCGIRVTADELYRRFFTEDADAFYDDALLGAAFFLDADGKAVHVAGWCGECYLNMSSLEEGKCGHFRSECELKRMYGHLVMKKRGMRI